MERKHLLLMACCTGIISMLMGILYVKSSLSKGTYRGNFKRKFIEETVSPRKDALALPYNSYYIAGATVNEIYLGNRIDPLHMIIIDTQSSDTIHVRLSLDLPENKSNRGFTVSVDSPYFFLMNGYLPAVFRGRLNEWNAAKPMASHDYFVDAVPIGTSSLVMRSYSVRSKAFALAKKTGSEGSLEFNYRLLEKQIDGIFCVTGNLHYSSEMEKLVYIYNYRNQYLVMDSSLNLSYRANTIDTFSHAPIKIAEIKSEGSHMLASPPTMVNRMTTVDDRYLYVNSNVMASNEDLRDFRNGGVMDVYDLAEGRYRFSFHLPHYKGKRLTDLMISNGKLIVLYGRYIVWMKLLPDVVAYDGGVEELVSGMSQE